jgi:hypothetical protein
MRAKRFCTIVLCVAAIRFGNLSRAQDATSAKAFLQNVYRHYQGGYRNESSGIDFDGPRASLYFHSSLLALEKADVKANSPDIQAIDWDPVCGCQDWDGIWSLKVEVHMENPQRARADVSFVLSDPKNNPTDATRVLQITLMSEQRGWRIYDILDRSDPKSTFSVRKLLENDLANLRSHPAPASH